MSPFKADQTLVASEMNRLVKDDLKQNFSFFDDNLPQI